MGKRVKKAFYYFILFNSLLLSEILPQQITVTSPNGGESWPAGTSEAITWTDNISEYVSIELYKGGFFYYTIVDSTASDAHFLRYIPDTTQGGDDYKIKITSVVNSSIFDLSDGDFTIIGNVITVTTPNGGENWQVGSTRAITWVDNINEWVSIEIYKGGSYYYTVIDSTPSDAHYSWDIPDTLQPGSDYRIKIISVDYSSIFDFSDGDFTVFGQDIIVATPNGGESWLAGTSEAITWTDNISEYVSIELYKGGFFYYTIVDSTASDFHFLWYIPDTTQGGDDYKIKITSV
ncbi:MAG: Ser-Thr-rich GPI-anchored membrane family protein, partial [Ignavibacteriaceae bacterium]